MNLGLFQSSNSLFIWITAQGVHQVVKQQSPTELPSIFLLSLILPLNGHKTAPVGNPINPKRHIKQYSQLVDSTVSPVRVIA